jgi:hypothetical protein
MQNSVGNRTAYLKEIKAFSGQLYGADVLKAQKIASVFSVVQREKDPTLAVLDTFLPGSSKRVKRLKEMHFNVAPSQMEQVVRDVAKLLSVTKMKAEECCCKILKTKEDGHDCNRPDQPLFRSILRQGVTVIEMIDYGKEPSTYNGISMVTDRAASQGIYLPPWMEADRRCRTLRVYFTSEKNLTFSVCPKITPAQKKALRTEDILSLDGELKRLPSPSGNFHPRTNIW